MEKEKIAKLVCFGYGGDTVHFSRHCYCQGYGNPERPHAADPSTKTIPDGTPVVDIRPAVDRSAGAVVSMPLVDVDLPPAGVDRLEEPSGILEIAMAGNQFGTLLSLQRAQRGTGDKYGALDSVAIDIYIDIARTLGARIGAYKAGAIVWES